MLETRLIVVTELENVKDILLVNVKYSVLVEVVLYTILPDINIKL